MMELSHTELGQGEDVLLIHGIISDKSFFEPLMEELKDHYHLIAYDRRGYGQNRFDPELDYSLTAQAEDAAKVLKACGGKAPAWIVGNSAGGLIALALYLAHPELVRGLLILEPSLTFDEASDRAVKEWNRELNGYVLSGDIKKAIPAFARVIAQPAEEKASSSMKELKRAIGNLPAFMLGELNEVQRYRPAKEEFADLKVPIRVLVTEGGRDTLFGTTSLSGAAVMGWEVAFLEGYHNALKDRPKASADALRKLIEGMK